MLIVKFYMQARVVLVCKSIYKSYLIYYTILYYTTKELTYDLFSNNFKYITTIDISKTIVDQMNEIIYSKYSLQYDVCDIFNLSSKYQQESFDVVIEKGLLDSIVCKKDCEPEVNKMMREIFRVLSKNGVFIFVSHGEPKKREGFIDKSLWTYQYEIPGLQLEIENEGKGKKTGEKSSEFYVYILKKK